MVTVTNREIYGGLIGLATGLALGVIATFYFSHNKTVRNGIYREVQKPIPKVLSSIDMPEVEKPTAVLGRWNNIENMIVDVDTGHPTAIIRTDGNGNPTGYDSIGDEIIFNKSTKKWSLSYNKELVPVPK